MSNIALLLSYVGTNYHGFQLQKNLPTIQGCLEEALSRLTGEERVIVHGCGRTDSGVHARRYIANFHTDNLRVPTERLPLALRACLPQDIVVLGAKEMAEDFHARFSCLKKEYVYEFYNSKMRDPFFNGRAAHFPYALKDEAMEASCSLFVGVHDFQAFAASGRWGCWKQAGGSP